MGTRNEWQRQAQAIATIRGKLRRIRKIRREPRSRVAAQAAPGWLRALQRNRLPDHARRGLALHESRRDRADSVPPCPQRPFPALAEAIIDPFRIPGVGCQLVFVDGRFAPERFPRSAICPTASRSRNLAAEIARNPGRGRTAPGPLSQYAARCLRRAEHRVSRRRRVRAHRQGRRRWKARSACCSFRPRTNFPTVNHPRNLIVAEENSQATIVEDYVSLGGGAALCNTVTELVAGDHSVVSHYMIEREHASAFNVSTLRIQQGRDGGCCLALRAAGRRAGAQQRASGAGRRRRRVPDQRPVHRQRPAAPRQLHARRARQPALRQPPVLQRHSRWPRARRVSRPHHRAQGRAEDRRQADQSQPAAFRHARRSTPSRSSKSTPTT